MKGICKFKNLIVTRKPGGRFPIGRLLECKNYFTPRSKHEENAQIKLSGKNSMFIFVFDLTLPLLNCFYDKYYINK